MAKNEGTSECTRRVNRGRRVHPKNYFEALKKIDELQHELSELRKADESARQIAAGLAARRVWNLRPREWLLLEELFARYPRIASMGELNDAVPSLSARERDEKIIDIWTHRIRARLKLHGINSSIETIWGGGRRLSPQLYTMMKTMNDALNPQALSA